MAKSTNLNFTQAISNPVKRLNNANGTTPAVVYTASANDAVIKSITVTSTDTSAVNLQLFVDDGTTVGLLGTVRIPAASGTDGATATFDILNSSLLPGLPVDLNGRKILPLKAGYILKAAPLVAITSAKQVDIFSSVEEY